MWPCKFAWRGTCIASQPLHAEAALNGVPLAIGTARLTAPLLLLPSSSCSGLPPLAPFGTAAGPSGGSRQQFEALQQHIDELTEEKLALTRGLAQQTRINGSLQDENEALAAQYNARGALVDELRKKVGLRRRCPGSGALVRAAVPSAHLYGQDWAVGHFWALRAGWH